MSAKYLRETAALMRERAEAAEPGPWRAMEYDDYPGDEGVALLGAAATVTGEHMIGYFHVLTPEEQEANGTHAASWHPAVALVVADLLDAAAKVAEVHYPMPVAHALQIARAYRGDT